MAATPTTVVAHAEVCVVGAARTRGRRRRSAAPSDRTIVDLVRLPDAGRRGGAARGTSASPGGSGHASSSWSRTSRCRSTGACGRRAGRCEAGLRGEVICPRGAKRDTEPYAEIEGVEIHRYPLRPPPAARSATLQGVRRALWHTLRWLRAVRGRARFDVVHACNPPDLLFLMAPAAQRGGTRFLFDHHDLVPELFESRFERGGPCCYWLSAVLERLTFAPPTR